MLAAGAIGGAVGSIVSQGVGIALGVQDKFSWSAVGRSALSGAVSAGVSYGLGDKGLNILQQAGAGKALDLGQKLFNAVVTNVTTQGVSIAVGLQKSFDWKGVAAAGVSAAIGHAADKAFGDFGSTANSFAGIVRNTTTGILQGAASQAIMRGKVDWANVATDAFGNALGNSVVGAMRSPAPQESKVPARPGEGNGVFKGGDESKKILSDRGVPFAELPNGDLYFASLDRSGKFVRVEGSEVVTLKSYRTEDGTIAYSSPDAYGNYNLPAGVESIDVQELRYGGKVLGRDYGIPKEWADAIQKSGVTAGDPVYSLRRQVAVDAAAHPELAAFIDAGTGQINPLQWNDFKAAAMRADIPMLVSSNGLGNFYQQARDNIRILSEGRNAVAVNVYNPTIDGGFVSDTLAEAVLGNLIGQRQTVQIAIQSQMRDALAYNAALDVRYKREFGSTLTDYIGHSQGTINGNLAIDRMTNKEKESIRVFAVGSASWCLPKGVAGFVNVVDKTRLGYEVHVRARSQ
jgi:hypothetical protein